MFKRDGITIGLLLPQTLGSVTYINKKCNDGEWLSGQRVWAAELAGKFDVSMALAKMALLIPQGEGLINNVPRRGSKYVPRDAHRYAGGMLK